MKKTFPYLSVTGTHKDVGFAVGEHFRDKIREFVAEQKSSIPKYKILRQKAQNHFLATVKIFPEYIEEITATALATDLSVMDLFFANTRSLYETPISAEQMDLVVHDKCTTIASFNEAGVIVGHNEDWAPEYSDFLYILKAKIGDTTFLGLNYAYELPGTSAGMNNWGLVQGVNEVHQVEKVGIPKNFIARAILESKSLGEAIEIIRKSDQDTGYNHVLVQGDKVVNVEIAGGEVDITIEKDRSYVHTNHFLSDLKRFETYHTKSSMHRFNSASELMKINMNENQILDILSDHGDSDYPICRHDATLASLLFNPQKGEMKVCYGPPCEGKFIKYTL
jgi:isopenicillin-N N-acyltransferase-like protein